MDFNVQEWENFIQFLNETKETKLKLNLSNSLMFFNTVKMWPKKLDVTCLEVTIGSFLLTELIGLAKACQRQFPKASITIYHQNDTVLNADLQKFLIGENVVFICKKEKNK